MILSQFVNARYAAPEQRVNFGPLLAGHPIGTGLVCCTYFNEGGGVRILDLVSGRVGALSGTGLPTWKNQYINCSNAAGGVPGIDFSTHPLAADLALGAFTVVARFAPDTNFSTTGGVAYRNDGNTVNAGWQLILSSGGMNLCIERATANFSARTTAVIPTTSGRWSTVAAVYPGDLTAANAGLYYDGVAQTHSSDSNGTGAQGSDAANSLILGAANFTNNSLNGSIARGWFHWIGIWRRVLRQSEIIALTVDPHLLIRPVGGFAITGIPPTPFTAVFPALTVAP